jgi:hypothetical protein
MGNNASSTHHTSNTDHPSNTDFEVETTNESGIVKQERALNQTMLYLGDRSLVRIDGLERATTLKTLLVQHQSTHFRCRISRILVRFVQLNNNCFVDVPACVLELTQLDFLSVRGRVLFLLFLRCALLTPAVQLGSNRFSSLPAAIGQLTALTTLDVRTDTAFALTWLTVSVS